jgi:hypothetical protein
LNVGAAASMAQAYAIIRAAAHGARSILTSSSPDALVEEIESDAAPTPERGHRSAFREGRHHRGDVVPRYVLVARLGRLPHKASVGALRRAVEP